MRVWALLTEDFRIFVYKQGYLRTTSSEYDTKNRDNNIHLTNQCLQIHCEGYGTFEEGNTLTFEQFQVYLNEEFSQHNLNIEEHFMPRIKDIIIDTFLSVRTKINPNRRKNVFELFGFDFLLDEDFRIWLIEVNTNPYLGTPNKDMVVLVPKMIDDLIKIAVDPICKPRTKTQGYDDNGFELIYREENLCVIPPILPVNQRRAYTLDLCYPIPELKPFIGKIPASVAKKSKKAAAAKKAIAVDTDNAAQTDSESKPATTSSS